MLKFFYRIGATLFLLVTFALTEQTSEAGEIPLPSSKSPWKWTLEERLEARSLPENTKAGAEKELGQGLVQIRGREHPELLLPFEIFQTFLGSAFANDPDYRDGMREIYERKAAELGFGKDMWARLERSAAPFLTLNRQFEQLATQPEAKNAQDLQSQQARLCAARADALAAAQKEFGKEVFLRLLYEVVAPSVSLSYRADPGSAEQLRFVESGCW